MFKHAFSLIITVGDSLKGLNLYTISAGIEFQQSDSAGSIRLNRGRLNGQLPKSGRYCAEIERAERSQLGIESSRGEFGKQAMHMGKKLTGALLMVTLLSAYGCKASSLVSKKAAMKFSCPSPTPQMSTDGQLKLLIPKNDLADHYSWNAKMAGLTDLRASALPAGDLEARVWVELFGRGLGMVALRRKKGVWSAIQIRPTVWDKTENLTEPYPEPSNGWNNFWDSLVAEGILALPDSSCFDDYLNVIDGTSYFVEFNLDGLYRCYAYYNPDFRTPEHGSTNPESMAAAKHMSNIACMIFNELRPETTK